VGQFGAAFSDGNCNTSGNAHCHRRTKICSGRPIFVIPAILKPAQVYFLEKQDFEQIHQHSIS
jgi:hypothetical protein